MLIVLYVCTCLFVGWLATKRGHSMVLYTLLSIFITPVLGLVILLLLVPSRPAFARKASHISCSRCTHELKHLKSLEYCSHCGDPL
jgi:hypothetical protein